MTIRIACTLRRNNPFYVDVMRGVLNYCREHPEVEPIRFEGTYFIKVSSLQHLSMDGVIGYHPDYYPFLDQSGQILPLVNCSHYHRAIPYPSVINDDQAVGELAASYLTRKPVHHLYCLSFHKPWFHLMRAIGFRRGVKQRGFPCTPVVISYPQKKRQEFYESYSYARLEKLDALFSSMTFPAALFCTDDHLASLVIDYVLPRGIKIPGDLRILGCGCSADSILDAQIPISTIRLSGREVGWEACDTLYKCIQGRAHPHLQSFPAFHVIERQSSQARVTTPFLRKAIAILKTEYQTPLSMKDVAQRVGVSRRKLEMEFNRELGSSPYDTLTRVRVENACQLLETTDLPIELIAERSGFGSQPTLRTYFQRHFNMPPHHWRKRHR